MTNGFRGLLVGGGEPIYVKLKEVEKLAVRHFKGRHRKSKFFLKKSSSQPYLKFSFLKLKISN